MVWSGSGGGNNNGLDDGQHNNTATNDNEHDNQPNPFCMGFLKVFIFSGVRLKRDNIILSKYMLNITSYFVRLSNLQ